MIGVLDHFDNLGNHIAAALHLDPVADLQAQPLNEVGVVQRGAAHRRAADKDRRQLGHRRQLAGAAHLHGDGVDLRDARLGGEFIRNGPARRAARVAEPLLRGVRVHLQHHAVDLVAQRGALASAASMKRRHLLNRCRRSLR